MNTPFSVCLSVYKNDSFEYVRQAIDSVTIGQTCSPSEMVIVIDGPINWQILLLSFVLCCMYFLLSQLFFIKNPWIVSFVQNYIKYKNSK